MLLYQTAPGIFMMLAGVGVFYRKTIFRAPLKYFRSQNPVYLTGQVTGDSATIAEFILNGLPDNGEKPYLWNTR